MMQRYVAAAVAVASAAGYSYYTNTASTRINLSGTSPTRPPPPTPAEIAMTKLRAMKKNYANLSSEQMKKELTMEEFFLTLGIDPATPFASKIALMADLDQNGTITFDEYSNFAKLLDHDILYASFLVDTDNDGKVQRQDMEKILRKNNDNNNSNNNNKQSNKVVLDSLFRGNNTLNVESQTFIRLLHVLEEDVLEASFRKVAVNDAVSASDLIGSLSDHGFMPSEELTNSVFQFVQQQPTQTVSHSQFRALFKVLRRVPQLERLLKLKVGANVIVSNNTDNTDNTNTQAKVELTRQELNDYLVRINPDISNSQEAVDVCFGIFDVDSSNTLSLSEMRMAHDNSSLSNGGMKKQSKMTTVQSLMIGAVSGAAGSCVVFPIYKVKTRLQSIPSTDTRGAFAQATEIVQKEGFFNLYRGLQAELAGIGPVKASALWANDFFRNLLIDKDGKLGAKEELMSGVGTGLIVTAFYCPQEIVTIRM